MVPCREANISGVNDSERAAGMGNPALAAVMMLRGEGRLEGDAVGGSARLTSIAFASSARESVAGPGRSSVGEPEPDRWLADNEGATGEDPAAKSSDCLWPSRTSPGS